MLALCYHYCHACLLSKIRHYSTFPTHWGEVFESMKLMTHHTLVLWLIFTLASTLNGQDFTASSDSAAAGGAMNITATLDNTGEGPIQGWSFGLCHDPLIATATLVNFEDSDGIDFNQTSIYEEGWTQGAVISFTGANPIESGTTGYIMSSADYSIAAAAEPGDYAVTFCDHLGSPPVTTVAVVGGASIPPTQNSGNMEVIDIPDPQYTYNAPDRTVNYNPDDGSASFTAEIQVAELDNSAAGAPYPNATQGFSMGLGHDETLLEATAVTATGVISALGGGNGPDFITPNLYSNGWTLGVVYSFTGAETISFTSTETVVEVSYSLLDGAMTGDEDGETTSLTWTNTLGDPAVTNVMVVSGASLPPELSDATISLEAVSVTAYLRSDANADRRTDIADAIWMLSEQFLNGPANNCDGAKDANGDGIYNVADPLYVINYRFTDGPAPPAPFPSCGTSADQTPEDCLEYPSCG